VLWDVGYFFECLWCFDECDVGVGCECVVGVFDCFVEVEYGVCVGLCDKYEIGVWVVFGGGLDFVDEFVGVDYFFVVEVFVVFWEYLVFDVESGDVGGGVFVYCVYDVEFVVEVGVGVCDYWDVYCGGDLCGVLCYFGYC